MDKKQSKRELAWASGNLIIYNICMFITILLYSAVRVAIISLNQGAVPDPQELVDMMQNDAGGYFFAVIVGLLIFTVYKEGRLWTDYVRRKNRKMSAKAFLIFLAFLYLGQLSFTLLANLGEFLLNQLGFSMMVAVESASAGSTTWTMFLYAGILAPITEELIFRGTILRALEPTGKVYAIVMSSVLFGLFHSNLPQSIFATMISLVLAYVALEYSIFWAIILHIFNNLIIGDFMVWLSYIIPGSLVTVLSTVLIVLGSVVAVYLLFRQREQIRDYIRKNRAEKGTVKHVLTSVWFWIFVLVTVLEALALITPL